MTQDDFKDFISQIKLIPPEDKDFYFEVIKAHLKGLKTERKHNINSYNLTGFDKIRIMEMINHICASNNLPDKIIKFEQPKSIDNYIFHIENKRNTNFKINSPPTD